MTIPIGVGGTPFHPDYLSDRGGSDSSMMWLGVSRDTNSARVFCAAIVPQEAPKKQMQISGIN
jgi:hypothetical protein